jgi:hypothetical protein
LAAQGCVETPVRAELRQTNQAGSTATMSNGTSAHKVWWWMPSTLSNITHLAPPIQDELEKNLMDAGEDLTKKTASKLDPDELRKWQQRGCQERKRCDFYTGFRKLVGETGHHHKNGGSADWVVHRAFDFDNSFRVCPTQCHMFHDLTWPIQLYIIDTWSCAKAVCWIQH